MIYFPLDFSTIVHLKCPVKKCPVKDPRKTAVATWGFPNGLM